MRKTKAFEQYEAGRAYKRRIGLYETVGRNRRFGEFARAKSCGIYLWICFFLCKQSHQQYPHERFVWICAFLF